MFFLSFLALFFTACDPPPGATVRYIFNIRNKGLTDIKYSVSKSYPDTSITDSISAQLNLIHPSKEDKYTTSDKWPEFFSKLPADTLSILFFSPDTVSKYGWKQVQSRYLILKRKDISLQDLENSNYVVTYP